MSACSPTSLVLVLAAGVASCALARADDPPPITWEPAAASHYREGRRAELDRIVIHTIEGSQRSAINTFRSGKRKVSAHYVVGKDGSIVQMVRDEDTAWHAGRWNARSIGIEHEGFADEPGTWTDAMLESSARLTRWLCHLYGVPIDREHIVGHVEVPGATHHDPGEHFDWERYLRLVRRAGGTSGGDPGSEEPTTGEDRAPTTTTTTTAEDPAPTTTTTVEDPPVTTSDPPRQASPAVPARREATTVAAGARPTRGMAGTLTAGVRAEAAAPPPAPPPPPSQAP